MKRKRRSYTNETSIHTLPEEFKHLNDKGWQVIPSLLSSEECEVCINKIWIWLAGMGTGIKKDDSSTWRGLKWPSHKHGIIQHSKSGHTDFAWIVRAHPSVHSTFSKIWRTDDLISSFDAVTIVKPPEVTGGRLAESSSGNWFHLDQGPRKQGRQCIQGLVTLENMATDDATLCVLEGSHAHHSEFYRKFGIDIASDWHKFTTEQIEWMREQSGVKELRVEAPRGSLVLWDSRTVHCTGLPLKNRKNPGRFRYIVYVCMAPRAFADKKQLEKKQSAFKNMRLTSHWPIDSKLFPTKPRTYGLVVPDYSIAVDKPPELTGLIKLLSGF